jgi:carbon monoxide dehydrogenase subunit G
MKLDNEFVVPVPRAQAWDVLMDVERIAPCMPGATFDGFEGESFKGRVKVKLGPITVTYSGVARFVEHDPQGGRAVIEASGKETRGTGTANATIETVLQDQGDHTLVKVSTDLNITGKPAQFGRGVMVEVGTKILGQFAECLASQLGSDSPAVVDTEEPGPQPQEPGQTAQDNEIVDVSDASMAAAADTGAEPAPPKPPPMRQSVEAIDLLDTAAVPVLKRALPVLGGVVALFLLFRIVRRLLR